MAGKVRIGTSGWSYSHWLKGAFYADGVRGGDCLGYYAGHFPSVEINSTYYRLPRPSFAEKWFANTPEDFVFAVKMWQMVTHRKRLAGVEGDLESFFSACRGLGSKFGPLLIQLPPSFHKDLRRLGEFAAACEQLWQRHLPPRPGRVAVEFRHTSWNDDQTRGLLSRPGWSLVLADMGDFAIDEPLGQGFIYIRRHGPAGGDTSYSDRQLRALADRIAGWSAAGRDVYVYFNNDAHAHAPHNAAALMEIVGRR
ncbi:MAG: hypothetical protein AMJ81_00685 [Phycisphaerae bacterium SM23_33]|nr:MAG: hypothetical protein AMJ81_00685 [Phycisphaerae bacterium SM23_33]